MEIIRALRKARAIESRHFKSQSKAKIGHDQGIKKYIENTSWATPTYNNSAPILEGHLQNQKIALNFIRIYDTIKNSDGF